ncbi:MAG: uracil-DNA glycosylase [Bacilli bacterium]|nr:uracil-DNA glycosylase [Bacilli bacterium]
MIERKSKKIFNNDWDYILKDEFQKEYFIDLIIFLNNENKNKIIYPKKEDLFKALKMTSYKDTKILILGQDPYHGEGEANGLCFSVDNNIKNPPSLQNIFKELQSDLNVIRTESDLTDWAKQGILLINTVLTVEKDKPFSHKNRGWETFTDEIIKKLNERKDPVIFVLWGNAARSKKQYITNKTHYIIESAHPSPLSYSRGFKDSKPFSKVNNILKSANKSEIKW